MKQISVNWVHTQKADQKEAAQNTLKKAKIMEKEKQELQLLICFIEKLKEARNIGLTQSEIAKRLNISTNTISRYKTGKGQMNTDTYENIINLINSKL
jgi:ribosome-binding protein aMBF1 (putative translation factor)